MTKEAARPERPYSANYLLGLMLVMGFSMLFNALAFVLYPYYGEETGESTIYIVAFVAISVYELVLTALMYIGSGIGYRLTKMSMICIVTLMGTGLLLGGNLGFDTWIQVLLAIAVLILMHLPSVSAYYNNLNLGTLPQFLPE